MKTTTGLGLSASEAFIGLVDYGLFSDVVPPCFVSEGISNYVPTNLQSISTETDDRKLRRLLDKASHNFIRFDALRHANIPRQMGIPHPESYIVQCLVIERYWNIIKRHCAKPQIPVSRIFVQETSDKRVFVMNYKRRRFEDEETDIRNMIGARFVVQTDISACFSSIYTHSIPWAIHGRRIAKTNRSLSLAGNLLDKATQGIRDGQTNRLVTGPHSSNIISEIVLTRVDDSMVREGYKRFSRAIDDYTYYSKTFEEAENFVRTLGMFLREYDISLNAQKTEIIPMPIPVGKDWVQKLRDFEFPGQGEIGAEKVNAVLDLAQCLSNDAESFATLNYAIQMIPARLSNRAKRIFAQRAISLALIYPYLARLLGEHVFDKHSYSGIETDIQNFVELLLDMGIKKLYPDAIAHALYYSLKYGIKLRQTEDQLREIIQLDDCISDVLLLEYSRRNGLQRIRSALRRRVARLKGMERREQDRFWLLIYEMWSEATLRGNGQTFLADLKQRRFRFIDV